MLSAATAREKSMLNADAKKYFKDIENGIDKAIDAGCTACRVPMDLSEDNIRQKSIVMAIKNELNRMGYTCEIEYARRFITLYGDNELIKGKFIIDWSE